MGGFHFFFLFLHESNKETLPRGKAQDESCQSLGKFTLFTMSLEASDKLHTQLNLKKLPLKR